MERMRTSTTTLGCPGWDLATVIENLKAYGYDAVDFRGLGESLDITKSAEFTTGLADTKRRIEDAGLAVSCISSSIRLCAPDLLEANLAEARRTIPIAIELGAPSIRVFGGGELEKHSREELAGFAADTMDRILALDDAERLQWGIETHDHWVAASDVRTLLDRIPHSSVGVVWDVGHTTRVEREDPASSWEGYGSRVINTHFKDAVYDTNHPEAMDDGWRYVPLGEGQLALAEAVETLTSGGYDGYLTLEHEKRWHPELREPEAAFPHALQWFRTHLADS